MGNGKTNQGDDTATKRVFPVGGAILIPPTRTDYIAGTASELVWEDLGINWVNYLPDGEKQYGKVDFYDCVSCGVAEAIETQLNSQSFSPTLTKWFTDNGYLKNGKFDLSSRYLAKMSGTTSWGNTWQNVVDAARHYGLVPDDLWPTNDTDDWNEFYKEIPQNVKDLGIKFAELLNVQYEVVHTGYPNDFDLIKHHLKHAPLQVIGFVCSGWSTQPIVQSCYPSGPQHETLLYAYDTCYNILDTYSPFLKKLAPDYYINFIGKVVIKEKNMWFKDDVIRAFFSVLETLGHPPVNETDINIHRQAATPQVMASGFTSWLQQNAINKQKAIDLIRNN